MASFISQLVEFIGKNAKIISNGSSNHLRGRKPALFVTHQSTGEQNVTESNPSEHAGSVLGDTPIVTPIGVEDFGVHGDGGYLSGSLADGQERNPRDTGHHSAIEESQREQLEPAPFPFRLSAKILAEGRGLKEKAQDNIRAIETLHRLDREERLPTQDERIALARYVGWGGLSDAFRSITGHIKSGWEDIAERLEALLTKKELDSARSTTLDAFFTSDRVISAMLMGVDAIYADQPDANDPRAILEPSCGVGHFIGKSRFDQAKFVATEIDATTAHIAQKLYPQSKILHAGYHQTLHNIKAPSFDLVIGNPPFGKMRVPDYVNTELPDISGSTHGYFFDKSIAQCAPGGVVSMVVSRYLMDSTLGRDSRKNIFKECALLGAARLPNGAFAQNANTDVPTDVIFLQKRLKSLSDEQVEALEKNGELPSWIDVQEHTLPREKEIDTYADVYCNSYFIENPQNVMGHLVVGRGMYRDNELIVAPKDDWEDDLDAWCSSIRPEYTLSTFIDDKLFDHFSKGKANYEDYLPYEGDAPYGSFIEVKKTNGETALGLRKNYFDSDLKDIGYMPVVISVKTEDDDEDNESYVARVSKSSYERLSLFLPIRDAFKELHELQRTLPDNESSNARLDELRASLRQHHQNFVDKFGAMNRAYNMRSIVLDEAWGYRVLALENNYDKGISRDLSKKTGEKMRAESFDLAPIMLVRNEFPRPDAPEKANSALEALDISLGFFGQVSPSYMSKITGMEWDALREELGEKIMLNEQLQWSLSDELADGDLVHKMNTMYEVMSEHPRYAGELEASIQFIDSCLPEPKSINEISVHPSATWLPNSIVRDFIERQYPNQLDMTYSKEIGQWTINTTSSRTERVEGRIKPKMMASNFINQTYPVIRDKIEGVYVVNQQLTMVARSRMDALNKQWDAYLTDASIIKQIEDAFNNTFRRFRDASKVHITMDFKSAGLSDKVELRQIQREGAQKICTMKEGSSFLADHAPGAGKTNMAVAASMKGIQIGKFNKGIVVVQSGTEQQYAQAYQNMFPSSKVMIADEKNMSSKKRQAFLSRFAASDNDVLIVNHSGYRNIPRPPEADILFQEEELDRLMLALKSHEASSSSASSIKKIESSIKRIKLKIEKKIIDSSSRRKTGIHFGDLGVNFVIYDESQAIKARAGADSRLLKNTRGSGNLSGSEMGTDALIKSDWLKRNKGYYIEMSGTPESNSLNELFMQMLAHCKEDLIRMKIYDLDHLIANFGVIKREFGYSLTGEYIEMSRLAGIKNANILRSILRSYRQSRSIEDVKKAQIEAGLPPMSTPIAQRIINTSEKTKLQSIIMGEAIDINTNGDPIFNEGSIMDRISKLEGKAEKGEYNHLVAIGDLKSLTLSPKAFYKKADPSIISQLGLTPQDFENATSPKIDQLVQNTSSDYFEWNEYQGIQMIFLDTSTPKVGRISREAVEVRALFDDIQKGGEEDASDEEITRGLEAQSKLDEREYTPEQLEELLNQGDVAKFSWNAYTEIRDGLIAQGVPEKEIAFVHDYQISEDREKLFGELRSGAMRIVLGSTQLVGVGVNIQNKAVSLHHVDVPYRPDLLTQRDGRIERDGNEFTSMFPEFKPKIYYYVTEESTDAAMWTIINAKTVFLNQIRVASGSDVVVEPDVTSQDVINACSGNQIGEWKSVVEKSLTSMQNAMESSRLERQSAARITEHYKHIVSRQERLGKLWSEVESSGLAFAEANINKRNAIEARHKDQSEAFNAQVSELRLIRDEALKNLPQIVKDWKEKTATEKRGYEDRVKSDFYAQLDQLNKTKPKVEHWLEIQPLVHGLFDTGLIESHVDAWNEIMRLVAATGIRGKGSTMSACPLFTVNDNKDFIFYANKGIAGDVSISVVHKDDPSVFNEDGNIKIVPNMMAMPSDYITCQDTGDKQRMIARMSSILNMPVRLSRQASENFIEAKHAQSRLSDTSKAVSAVNYSESIQFLSSSIEMMVGVLRSGFKKSIHDVHPLIAVMNGEDIPDNAPDYVKAILSNAKRTEAACELNQPHVKMIELWIERGEEIIERLSHGDDSSAELINGINASYDFSNDSCMLNGLN